MKKNVYVSNTIKNREKLF